MLISTPRRCSHRSALAFACGASIAAGSCVTLKPYEKAKLVELEAAGVATDSEGSAIPGLAGALNILPGAGDIYLAIDSGEGVMWANFVPDLLFWPISIAWAIPQAVVNGNRIQEAQTAEHYIMIDLTKKAGGPQVAGRNP